MADTEAPIFLAVGPGRRFSHPHFSMSSKIILVKRLADGVRATAAVVGETGAYWRSFGGTDEVTHAAKNEAFDLFIVDHRGIGGNPLELIEGLRGPAGRTPLFLISDPLELEVIIQAIRVGVKDLFHPPLDVRAIIDRVQAQLRFSSNDSTASMLERWRELVMFLAEGALPGAGSAPIPDTPQGACGVSESAQALLKAEREHLAGQLKAAEAERERMQQERDQLQAALSQSAAANGAEDPALHEKGTAELERERLELSAAREKLETEQLLLTQGQKKLDAAATEARKRDAEAAESAARTSAAEARIESEQMVLKQASARLASERAALEQQRTELQRQQQAVAEKEALVREREAKVDAQVAALKKQQAQLANERAVLSTEKAALDEETAALAERMKVGG